IPPCYHIAPMSFILSLLLTIALTLPVFCEGSIADSTTVANWQQLMQTGTHKWESGDFENGVTDLLAALKECDSLPKEYAQLTSESLSDKLRELGRYDEAIEMYHSLIDKYSDNNSKLSLAALLDRQGKFDPQLYASCNTAILDTAINYLKG